MVVVPAPEIATRPAGEAPTLLFLGDTAPTDAATEALRARGWDYPFARTAPIVRAADLAVANFESSIAAADVPFGVWKRYRYRAEPDALAAIARAGIDALAQQPRDGLWRAAFATGHRRAAACDVRRRTRRGRGAARVVVVWRRARGACSVAGPGFVDAGGRASPGRPGVALSGAMCADVARMRRHADVVIASVHWARTTMVTGGQAFRACSRRPASSGQPPPHVAAARHDRSMVVAYASATTRSARPPPRVARGLMLRALRDRRLRVALVPIDVQNRREVPAARASRRRRPSRPEPLRAQAKGAGCESKRTKRC